MASEKITAMIEDVKSLSVLELSELVNALEEEFGVSAAAACCCSRCSGCWCCCSRWEEKTEFDVVLKDVAPTRSLLSRLSAS